MYLGVVVVFIVVLVVLSYYSINVHKYESMLTGFWFADDAFCSSAGINSFMMWIGEPIRSVLCVRRQCIAVIDSAITSFEITYRRGYGSPFISKYTVSTSAKFAEGSPQLGLPTSAQYTLDPVRMILRIYSGTTIYARMYRANDLSDLDSISE